MLNFGKLVFTKSINRWFFPRALIIFRHELHPALCFFGPVLLQQSVFINSNSFPNDRGPFRLGLNFFDEPGLGHSSSSTFKARDWPWLDPSLTFTLTYSMFSFHLPALLSHILPVPNFEKKSYYCN